MSGKPVLRERTKRQRFLPYAFARFGLGFELRRCVLDGAGAITELDRDRRLVELDDEPWETLSVEGELRLPAAVLGQVLPEAERKGPPVGLWVVARCRDTRLRRGFPVRVGRRSGIACPFRIELTRKDCFGTVELTPYAVRTAPATPPAAGFASSEGARLASARAWELRVDRRREPGGRFLDVRYRSFSEDEVLAAFANNVYHLDHESETPILWINEDHEAIAAVLNARGATGTRARLREVLYDQISQGVWTQLFLRAAMRLTKADGETAWEWEDAVLRQLLAQMYPKLRTHAARLSSLRDALLEGDLPRVAAQLDAALQRKNETAQHMTRLVEEVMARS